MEASGFVDSTSISVGAICSHLVCKFSNYPWKRKLPWVSNFEDVAYHPNYCNQEVILQSLQQSRNLWPRAKLEILTLSID